MYTAEPREGQKEEAMMKNRRAAAAVSLVLVASMVSGLAAAAVLSSRSESPRKEEASYEERDWATVVEVGDTKMFVPNGGLTADTQVSAFGCTLSEAVATLPYLMGEGFSLDADRLAGVLTAVAVDDSCYDDDSNAALVYASYAILCASLPEELEYEYARYGGDGVELVFLGAGGSEVVYEVDYRREVVRNASSGESVDTGMFNDGEVALWASTMCTGAQLHRLVEEGRESELKVNEPSF